MAVFLIPPILTEADWNKNKGVIAKMAGETGIGAALKKLSDLHKPIDFYQVKWSRKFEQFFRWKLWA